MEPGKAPGTVGLDGGAAMGAPGAMDRVLGDHRRDVGGDVVDDPRPRGAAAANRAVALGTGFKGVCLASVDSRRRGPTPTGMSLSGASGFNASLGGRLGIGRRLSRGRRKVHRGRRADPLLGQLLGQVQEREDDRFLTLLKDQRGLLGRQLWTEKGQQGCRIRGIRTRRCHGNSGIKRSADCKIN